jgi:hypothetical protein
MQVAVADWGFAPSEVWEPAPVSEKAVRVAEERISRWWSRRATSPLVEIERREELTLQEPLPVDVAALPGRNLTMELLEREAEKRKLKSLIEHLFHQPLSWGLDEPTKLTWGTQLATLRLIDLLPDDIALPQVAPDGEGGIALHWEMPDHRHHLGGVDGWRLHFVLDAGQAHARYLDDVQFNGDAIPDVVLQSLEALR